MIRRDYNDLIFRTQKEKDQSIIDKIDKTYKNGQPILVFTSSINKSEHYSGLLNKKGIKHLVLNAKNHEREAEIIANAGKKNSVIITTSISGRGVDIKLGGKNELDENKKVIKQLGGLYVIGTERLESRRVDNQARGRSGRQGDEGSSIFFVSLEDDLMRIFGSDSLDGILKKLGLKDGESIDHPWINKALERAQQKVEARNFDIRKTLLKFDNVLNDQRQVIFTQRNNILNNNKNNYVEDFLEEILINLLPSKNKYKSDPKGSNFLSNFKQIFGKSFNEDELNDIINMNSDDFKNSIKSKFNNKKEERVKYLGEMQNFELEKRIFLQIIDQNWKGHIQYLEQLRQVIGLRSYGNRDPLIEYKKEAYSLFENLLNKLKNDLVTILLNLSVQRVERKENSENLRKKLDPRLIGKKIGRNELCFCGSKKKYKHCCGSL